MGLPALVALMVLAHTAFAGGRVALTLAAIRIGGSPLEVGLVVSLLAVVPMFLSVHAGRWTDRRGVFLPTLCALLAIEAGLLLAPLPSLAGMGASAVLLGSGFMLVYLAINNAVGHGSAPEDRHRAYSMLALGNSTSTVAGPVAAGFLIDLVGHAWTFLVLAALPPLALAVLRQGRHAMATIPAPARHAGKARMADLLRHAPLRAVFVVGVLLSMGWDLFTFMMPMHGERIGLSASAIGLVMGAFGGGTFFVRLFIPALARRFAEWRLLGGALAVTAAIYLALPFFRALPLLFALAFTLGSALGSALPMMMSAIGRTAPHGRSGEAIGIRSMLTNASQALLPLSLGALGSALGTPMVFWTLAVLLGAGTMLTVARLGR
jgi:predicted MFS family arabinose efflux permease